MLSSCGEPFGDHLEQHALPFGLGITGLTCATPGSAAIAVAQPRRRGEVGRRLQIAREQQRTVEARAEALG